MLTICPPDNDCQRELARLRQQNQQLQTQLNNQTRHATQLQQQAEKQRKIIRQQEKTQTETNNKLDQLASKIQQLEHQITANSSNSSVPPSSNPIGHKHPRPYPKRATTVRKHGGQPKHAGTTLERLHPAETIMYEPTGVCGCGVKKQAGVVIASKTIQTIGVETNVIVVDHVKQTRECACGIQYAGVLPEQLTGVKTPVVYDTTVKTLAVGLSCAGPLPSRVVAMLLEGFYGIPVASSSIINWQKQTARNLDGWDTTMVGLLKQAGVVHVDETPVKVEGYKNAHAHVACTRLGTRFHLAGRGKQDIIAGGVIENHPGILVSDCLPAYWGVGVAAHQVCLAHLIRELEYAVETFTPHDTATPHPYPGLIKVKTRLQAAINETKTCQETGDPPPGGMPVNIIDLCDTATVELTADTPSDVLPSASVQKTVVLLRRLVKLQEEGSLLGFMDDYSIPTTNNLAEQALRPLKVKQRRSGSARSVPHTRVGLRLAGYMDTCRKQGYDLLDALAAAVAGTPFVPTVV